MFMKWRGFNIDSSLFNLKFNAPQNFASYRQSELDTTRIGAFTQLEALPYMSKRFLLQRFLGLTEEEISENEEMWREERDDPEMSTNAGQDMRSIGITPGGLEADVQTGEEVAGMTPQGAGAPAVTPGTGPAAPGGVMPAGGAAAPGV
jgi:hypothetical protein